MDTTALMTVEQFAEFSVADPGDYELVEGELVPLSSGTPRHSIIRDLLGELVRTWFRRNPVGRCIAEVDCQLSDHTVRRPDLSIFLGERAQGIDLDRIPTPFAPDIAVEVLSASERAMDVRRKVREYLRAGSSEVWLLDHVNGEALVYTNSGVRILQGTDVLESPSLPGFAASVQELLA